MRVFFSTDFDARDLCRRVERVGDCKRLPAGSKEDALDRKGLFNRTIKREQLSCFECFLQKKAVSLLYKMRCSQIIPGSLFSSDDVVLEMTEYVWKKYSRLIKEPSEMVAGFKGRKVVRIPKQNDKLKSFLSLEWTFFNKSAGSLKVSAHVTYSAHLVQSIFSKKQKKYSIIYGYTSVHFLLAGSSVKSLESREWAVGKDFLVEVYFICAWAAWYLYISYLCSNLMRKAENVLSLASHYSEAASEKLSDEIWSVVGERENLEMHSESSAYCCDIFKAKDMSPKPNYVANLLSPCKLPCFALKVRGTIARVHNVCWQPQLKCEKYYRI